MAGVDDGIHAKFINLEEESETSEVGSNSDRSAVKYTFDGVPLTSVDSSKSSPVQSSPNVCRGG